MSNVVRLPQKPTTSELKTIAMGRSRKSAFSVIIARLKELRFQAHHGTCVMLVRGRETVVDVYIAQVGNVNVQFIPRPIGEGTYFCILLGSGLSGDRVMTGYLDPFDGPCGLLAAANERRPLHALRSSIDRPVSWKRGPWQADLFNIPRDPNWPPGGRRKRTDDAVRFAVSA